ncbi:MAG: restriction endonuclease subunit S [Betaproteobacteria bacterium]
MTQTASATQSKAYTPDIAGPLHPIGTTGKYVNGLAFKPTDWGDDGMPIIRIQNLTDRTKPMNRTMRKVDPVYIVQPGDLLVSWSATLDAFIWDREPALLNQHIFKVIPDADRVSKKYLYYSLRRAIAEMLKSEHLHGSTMKHINRGPFLSHEIAIPPLNEQEVVVAEIEKQFSRLDEAVANLKRVRANLKRYTASVYEESFRDEPNFTFGDLVAEGPQNGLYLPKERYGEGVPILRIDDYQTQWIRHIADLRRVSATSEQVKAWSLNEGDLIINRVNSVTHLGKCVIVPTWLAGAVFESNMMRIRLNDAVVPVYVEHYLASRLGKSRLTQNAKWAVNQASINQGDVRATPIFVPEIQLQRKLVSDIDRRLSIVRRTDAQVDSNLRRAERMRQSILAAAFSQPSKRNHEEMAA